MGVYSVLQKDTYNKGQKLASLLFVLSSIRKDQLPLLTGWKESTIRGQLDLLRRREEPKHRKLPSMTPDEKQKWNQKQKEKRDLWLKRTYYGSHGKRFVCYTLGQKGTRYAASLLGEPMRKPLMGGEEAHFAGCTDILCRLLLAGVHPIEWYGTRGASGWCWRALRKRNINYDFLEQTYEVQLQKKPEAILNPDAMMELNNGDMVFLEYDRGTERGKKLEDKFHNHFQFRALMQEETPPVIWVTTTQKRADNMRQAMERAKQTYHDVIGEHGVKAFDFPDMYFFVEEDETDFLADLIQQGHIDISQPSEKETAAPDDSRMQDIEEELYAIRQDYERLKKELDQERRDKERLRKQYQAYQAKYKKLLSWSAKFSREMEHQTKGMWGKSVYEKFVDENGGLPE